MSNNLWQTTTIGNILSLEYGASLPESDRSGGNYPVFGSNGMVGRHSLYLVKAPGIIVGRKGSVGAVSWSDEPFWPIDTTYYVDLAESINPRWCFWLLQLLELRKLDSSTGVPGLNRNDVYNLTVSLPSKDEQIEIARILDTADETVANTKSLITKLEHIRKGIMHDLLTKGLDESGEVRDPETHPEQFHHSILGKVPKGWTIQRLGQMCDLLNGLAFKPSDWTTTGVPIIRIQNLSGGQDFNYFRGIVPEKYYIDPGILLFSWSGNRETSFGSFIWRGPRGVLNQHIFKVTPHGGIRTEWFYYALDDVRQRVERVAHGGSGLVHIRRSDLCEYLIATPDEKEQKQIENALDKIEKRIKNEEQYLSKLKAIKTGLMQDLLAGRVRVQST